MTSAPIGSRWPARVGWERPDRLAATTVAPFLALVRQWESMMVARAAVRPAQE